MASAAIHGAMAAVIAAEVVASDSTSCSKASSRIAATRISPTGLAALKSKKPARKTAAVITVVESVDAKLFCRVSTSVFTRSIAAGIISWITTSRPFAHMSDSSDAGTEARTTAAVIVVPSVLIAESVRVSSSVFVPAVIARPDAPIFT